MFFLGHTVCTLYTQILHQDYTNFLKSFLGHPVCTFTHEVGYKYIETRIKSRFIQQKQNLG